MNHFRRTAAVAAALSLTLVAAAPALAQDDDDVLVTGIEYAFEGIPAELPTGTDLKFTNAGVEVHELALVRVADGVTESVEELLLDPEAAMEEGKVVFVPARGGEAPLFAAPGEDAFGEIDLDLPGTYVAACFIPQGLTDPAVFELLGPGSDPEALPEDVQALLANPPHIALGMVTVFTVTGEAMVDDMDDDDDMDSDDDMDDVDDDAEDMDDDDDDDAEDDD